MKNQESLLEDPYLYSVSRVLYGGYADSREYIRLYRGQ